MGGGEVCVCVVVYINVCRMGEEARASHCSALPRGNFSSSDLAKATVRGSQKRYDLFCLRVSNRIPIPRLLLCPFWSPIPSIFL